MLRAGIYDHLTLKFNIHVEAQRENDLRKNSYVPTYTIHDMNLAKAGFDQKTQPVSQC